MSTVRRAGDRVQRCRRKYTSKTHSLPREVWLWERDESAWIIVPLNARAHARVCVERERERKTQRERTSGLVERGNMDGTWSSTPSTTPHSYTNTHTQKLGKRGRIGEDWGGESDRNTDERESGVLLEHRSEYFIRGWSSSQVFGRGGAVRAEQT